jgi:hypothetical protein
MYGICDAILAINPKASCSVNAEDLDQITWHNGTAVISKSDIQAKQAELKADYDSKQYQRDRAEAYPSWQDQLDKIYHDGVTKWKSEMIDPIKDAHPKP